MSVFPNQNTPTMFWQKEKPKEREGPVKVNYDSKDVEIPKDFLASTPYDAQPITYSPIEFENTDVPEFTGGYAVVLDNVLSPSECCALISLAEQSVIDENTTADGEPWIPARVHVGGGYEVLEPTYRNSDRIVWDRQEIVDRLWQRMNTVPQVADRLKSFGPGDFLGYPASLKSPGLKLGRWNFHAMNKRMRFLKYGPGQFFRAHCDGPYGEETPEGDTLQTHFTVHLYLNDSRQAIEAERKARAAKGEKAAEDDEELPELVGGATCFLSNDEKRKIDVDPRAGRVLIFQHRRLYHSGDDVLAGTKYTMRCEIMYKLQKGDAD